MALRLSTAPWGAPHPTGTPSRRAVFLDKDGTLVRDVAYNVDPRRIEFLPGTFDGLTRIADAGYLIIVVSNQPGIALGRFTESELSNVAFAISERLADAGLRLAGFYACPHGPTSAHYGPCTCRKPAPGLLQLAARDHGIALSESWMVGDILDDIEAGSRAGCRTVLLDVGNETEWRSSPLRRPTARARDLAEAASIILAADSVANEVEEGSEQ